MLVLHVNWAEGGLRLWAESLSDFHHAQRAVTRTVATLPEVHPFAVDADVLGAALVGADLLDAGQLGGPSTLRLRLPAGSVAPRPSDRLSSAAGEIDSDGVVELRTVEVPALALANAHALAAVLRLEDRGPTDAIAFGHSLPWWIAMARFVLELLADQRFIPTVIQPSGDHGALRAAWMPWLQDESARNRMAALLASMPPVVRAVEAQGPLAEPWRILSDAVQTLSDATARHALIEADFIDAIEGRDPADDPSVAWLTGLLDRRRVVPLAPRGGDGAGLDMLRQVRSWLLRLEDADLARPFRLGFRLLEPDEAPPGGPPESWWLSFHLLVEGEPPATVELDRVWAASPAAQVVDGHHIDRPQELVLAELGRAGRVYAKIESALNEAHPLGIHLTTEEAAQFLREDREVLEESGFDVVVPQWWGKQSSRLGVRLQVHAPAEPGEPYGSEPGGGRMGLDSLVHFRWQLAVGDQPLTAEDLRQIAESTAPLIRIADRWVEKAGALARAAEVVEHDPGGEVTLRDAIRMAQGAQVRGVTDTGLPVLGLDAQGWVGRVLGLGASMEPQRPDTVDQPASFHGQLRPYQKTGLGWLAFLERFGFGACLADDMGLGKTIQLIALLLHEREQPHADAAAPGTTLLVVPTSLIRNWARELARFGPSLRHHEHHGPQRLVGEAFDRAADAHDVVITTYALVARDRETIGARRWWRVVLDEAQFIKNPPTQQASAIRLLDAQRRVALTGTPVENRLTELWSIMDFCNPGHLGPAEDFRRRCAVPIERHRDQEKAESLRRLVHPFILRRLKTDPTVIVDLPACTETREYATLTPVQAALYQAIVDDLLCGVDDVSGIQRRGRVLAALTRLKQICNHPAQLPDTAVPRSVEAAGPGDDRKPLSSRSGKCARLMKMLEELLAAGDSALIFTQYRRMGHLLAAMIRQDLDIEAPFMHGGTSQPRRQEMIDRFQESDGTMPIFVLSLKTGGIGLNLTAANHVFHFDRWWNPAVENQATDRAYRIGQTRTVHVHKFVCVGTLEERIDQMIEQKTALADNVISSGEQWLTELTTEKLGEMLRLRAEAMEVDA